MWYHLHEAIQLTIFTSRCAIGGVCVCVCVCARARARVRFVLSPPAPMPPPSLTQDTHTREIYEGSKEQARSKEQGARRDI
jgi:hypothetical protein